MSSLFEELKRRNVIRLGVLYLVASWLILQVGDILFDVLELPSWTLKLVLGLLVLGLPIVLGVAWIYEVTPEGVKRESEIDRSASITPETGQRVNVMTIVLLIAVAGIVLIDRFAPRIESSAPDEAETVEAEPASEPETPTAPVKAERPVIAVLPLTARSLDGDGSFLADGIHDDLLTQLSRLGAFQVVSRTSVNQYRGTTKTIPEIGRELGATAILEGGVQQAAGRVRINAQLIDTTSDTHLWSETFERELNPENIFRIQAEIAGAIANAMNASLSDGDRQLLAEVPTTSQAAYEAFLRGRIRTYGIDMDFNRQSVAEFELAVTLDPEFAEAWAWLGFSRFLLGWSEGVSAEGRAIAAEGLEAVEQARALKPGLAEADYAEAHYHYWFEADYPTALALVQPLIDAQPFNADYVAARGWFNRRYGRWDQAVADLEAATRLDPRNSFLFFELGNFHQNLGNFERARAYIEQGFDVSGDRDRYVSRMAQLDLRLGETGRLDLDGTCRTWGNALWPCRGLFHFFRGDPSQAVEHLPAPRSGEGLARPDAGIFRLTALQLAGRSEQLATEVEQAIALLDAYLESAPTDPVSWSHLSWARLLAGDREGALEARAETDRHARRDVLVEAEMAADSATFYAMLGDSERALTYLADAMERAGGYTWAFAEIDPRLESLRELPGYAALAP
ncbi:MAG: hypothetical protein AAGE01_02470 [Pseudomonadota bacterium]